MSNNIASRTPCPYCTTSLGDSPVHECDGCGARHHADCWTANGGCAVALCVAGPEGSDPTLRPPVSERRVLVVDLEEPPRPPAPSPRDIASSEQRRLALTLLALAAGLLLLLLLIVVVFS